jgi:hypothetical protein
VFDHDVKDTVTYCKSPSSVGDMGVFDRWRKVRPVNESAVILPFFTFPGILTLTGFLRVYRVFKIAK